MKNLLRVSDTEYEMIKHRMKLCNEKNTTIDNMNYELNKIGANINQIAHRVNGTGSIYESDMKNLTEAMRTIWQLLKSTLLDDQ